MSPKDIRHYKFLRRAIEFKYKSPAAPVFETYDYDPYIFRWASNTFYELRLFDYLDIRERVVLVRLYENLKKDPRLKFLDDPDSLKDQDQFKLTESFHQRIEAEKTKLQAVSRQTAPAGGSVVQSTQPTTQKTPRINIRPPRVSFGAGNVLRNFSSQSQIFLKKNVFGKILTPTRLVTGFTTILGGIAGSILGPVGTLAGAGAGFLTPSYVKTFGTRHLTRAAHWGADSMVRLSSQTSRFSVGGFGGRGVTGKRVAIAVILLFFGVGALAAFAPLPGQQTPPAAAAPGTPPEQIRPVGEVAERIADAAKQTAGQLQFCAGGTFGPSYHCWDQMGIYDQAGDSGYLQCTEFVWAVFDKAGFLNEINLIRNNNAADWPKPAQNYPQIFSVFDNARQLLPGDIISLGGKPIGQDSGVNSHLAIVIEKGENVVRVAQAATDSPLESWDINTTTGELNPLKGAHPQTRMYVQGFIRLIGKL